MSAEGEARIRAVYDAFNRRDMEALATAIDVDAVWSNSMTGGYLYGREAVLGYWMRQFEQVQNFVEPQTIRRRRDGAYLVRATQRAETLDRSEVLFDAVVQHEIVLGDDGAVVWFQAL